jgi:hypothetical protein
METYDCQDIDMHYCETCLIDCVDSVLEDEEENGNCGYAVYNIKEDKVGLLINLSEWVIFLEHEGPYNHDYESVQPYEYPLYQNFTLDKFKKMTDSYLFLGKLKDSKFTNDPEDGAEVLEQYGSESPQHSPKCKGNKCVKDCPIFLLEQEISQRIL